MREVILGNQKLEVSDEGGNPSQLVLLGRNQHWLQKQSLCSRQRVASRSNLCAHGSAWPPEAISVPTAARSRRLDVSGAISGNQWQSVAIGGDQRGIGRHQRGHQWQSAWRVCTHSASSPQTAGSRDACIKLSITQRGGLLPSERSTKGTMNTGEKSRMISSTYLMRHAIRGHQWPSVSMIKPGSCHKKVIK